MKAGELSDRVVVERATTASDGMGGQTVTWATAYTLWAKVRPVKGRETEYQARLAAVETFLIVVRYGPTITAEDRISWDGKKLNIRTVQDRDGDSRWLTIEAESGLGT